MKGDKDYERGVPPPALMAAIGALGEEMVKSGNLLEMGAWRRAKADAIELGRRLQVHADVRGRSYRGQLEIRQLFDPPQQA